MPTCTPNSTTTTHYGLCKPADGETSWGTAYRTSMDTIDTQIFNLSNATPRSYLAGLQTTPTVATTSISIAVGVAIGNDQATSMVLGSTLVKVISSTWAVGTGNGGMTSATSIQANQSYHLFLIERTDTSVVDAYVDTSITAANIPANYTIFRRIASFKTQLANANFQNWFQDGDLFQYDVPGAADQNTNNPGNSAVTVTLNVPTGAKFYAILNGGLSPANSPTAGIWFSDLAITDTAPSVTVTPFIGCGSANAANAQSAGQFTVRTNTSGQIRSRMVGSAVGVTAIVVTTGWIDRRGRDA